MNELSKSLIHLSDPMSSTPFGDIVSLMTVLPELLCPASALAISSHWYSVPQILKAHSSLHSSLCSKSQSEELFYTVVSNIPPASLLFALYVHMCECVFVQNPFKSLDGKRTFVTILMSVAHKRLPGMC